MKSYQLQDYVLIAMFSVIIAICAWISIPVAQIAFTMQTFAIFVAVGCLGLSRGTLAVVIYILLGILGIPVFSGFRGGFGVLAGPTGGYIMGFVFTALSMGGIIKYLGRKPWALILGMIVGLAVCYGFGTAWFLLIMGQKGTSMSINAALMTCVVPYLGVDAVKIGLATIVIRSLIKIPKLGLLREIQSK